MGRRFRSALVTGGAGFIGSRLLPLLAPSCDRVTVFDNLHAQVHGADAAIPDLADAVFVRGDMRDRAAVERAVADSQPDLVVHLAAETGTGQSYDEIGRYCEANIQGTAYLAEAVRRLPTAPAPRRIMLASSRAIYGEGAYRDAEGAMVVPPPRREADMAAGRFHSVANDGSALEPIPTPEDAPPAPTSIYASTKLMQEYVLRQAFEGSAVELVVLRFQNVYGPGQSLRNPYTGVLSIFGRIILTGGMPDIFEDGDIVRDFVHVADVVRAITIASTCVHPPVVPINIGTGRPITILEAARILLRSLGAPDECTVSGHYRIGDVRHAVADIARAETLLGWRPEVPVEDGIADLGAWIASSESGLLDAVAVDS